MIINTADADWLSGELNAQANKPTDTIVAFFDARGLPCPMPLLKAKVSLRQVADGKALYLVASDKNSQNDLVAFCQKNTLLVHTWHSTNPSNETQIVYHFVIQKPTCD